MSQHRLAALVGLAALAATLSAPAARAQDSTSASTTDTTSHHHHMMKGGYSATLASPSGGAVTGKAWVHGTMASVMLMGDSAGVVRPWHVHKGTCGNDLGIFGDPSAYKPITIGSSGKGNGKATLSMALPDTGSYFVNIHASSSNMKTIVACGALAMNK